MFSLGNVLSGAWLTRALGCEFKAPSVVYEETLSVVFEESISRVHLSTTNVNKFLPSPGAACSPPASQIINYAAIVKDRDKPTLAINQQDTAERE